MTENLLIAFAVLAAAILFVSGIVVLALGARGWAYAIADAHRASSHGVELGERKETYRMTHDALDDAEERTQAARAYHPPATDDELKQAIIAEREAQKKDFEREYTTESNEGVEETPPIPPGGFYNVADVLSQ